MPKLLSFKDDSDVDSYEILTDHKALGREVTKELLEILLAVTLTDDEYNFVVFKLDGYTNEEVAKHLDLTYQQVCRIKRELETKYLKEIQCENPSTSRRRHSSCTKRILMSITSVISVTQNLHETHRLTP